MHRLINGGIYEVDLEGKTAAEFVGKHPSLIIRNLKENDMYYIIPLTTFTEERWKDLRKQYCCRIVSTNSIARVDKFQVRHKDFIPSRYFSNYKVLRPTLDELMHVNKSLSKYIALSIERMEKEYYKYNVNCLDFEAKCSRIFKDLEFDNFSVFSVNTVADENKVILSCDLRTSGQLTFDDMKDIVRMYCDRRSTHISYDLQVKKLIIKVDKTSSVGLTLLNKYDSIMVLKGI